MAAELLEHAGAPIVPRHVLMTADTVGGVWTYALELARALSTVGTRVTLATMGAPLREDQWSEAAEIEGLELRESSYRLEWMEEPWEDVDAAGEWLLSIAREIDPDVIHLNGYAHASLPWTAPVLVVAHSCVESWWRAVHGASAPEEWSRYRTRVGDGLRSAEIVVAPTEAMLDALRDCHGEHDAMRVVPNGRDPRRFRRRAKAPVVLSAGRLWDAAKNVATLAEASRGLAWRVAVAGDAGGATPSSSVEWLGRLSQSELRGWLESASIYALPARYEPFGLSIVEAGLCGCALVLGDIPSLRENWGEAALFVPPDDADALRSTIAWLIQNPDMLRAYGMRARLRALDLNPGAMLAGYLEIYHELARCGRRSSSAMEVTACAS